MSKKPMRARAIAGYTLAELLVTMVILGILAGIAIPAYTTQVRKSRRTDAKTALLDIAGREERLLSTTNAYSSTPSDIGYAGTFPLTVGDGYYTVTITGPPSTFTLQATPVAGKGQDKDSSCASFSVDQTGKQTAVDTSGNDTTATCWR
jgi:type IV pilus assembly protein PilE